MRVVWDLETYPNCFTLSAELVDYPFTWCFEISPWRDDTPVLREWLRWVKREGGQMVGFNNVGFDYPVLHHLIARNGCDARSLYDKAMQIIHAQDDNRFASMVYAKDRHIEQIDLFKIHHFDNRARSTSLKVLEFNMLADNVSDLPFPVGSELTPEQIEVLKVYNAHDVAMTKKFYFETVDQIDFRTKLTKKHGRDFMNHSDVKIGKEIFQIELEKVGVQCYDYGPNGREPKQTLRESIPLVECIPPGIGFTDPEFERIQDYLKAQTLSVTKGAFKDLTAVVGGLSYVFGTGGLHASVERRIFNATDEMMILDVDVTSLYPSIAIEYGYYPEHLGEKFVRVYKNLREQRVSFKKGTPENAMLKLALNGVYGASNDPYSVFYDPKFTMSVTLTGQMLIAMLVEWLLSVGGVEVIQCNTDGITLHLKRTQEAALREACTQWESRTRLHLEYAEYKRMVVRDVNSYVAQGVDGKVKRKGTYEYDLEWHQNHSMKVVAKVAEKVLLNGADIDPTVRNWPDKLDFMKRVKVPRNSRLQWGASDVQNTTRYYVSTGGMSLNKVMPPLKGKEGTENRYFAIEAGRTVQVCNDIRDATLPIDYDYYIEEVKKLTEGFV